MSELRQEGYPVSGKTENKNHLSNLPDNREDILTSKEGPHLPKEEGLLDEDGRRAIVEIQQCPQSNLNIGEAEFLEFLRTYPDYESLINERNYQKPEVKTEILKRFTIYGQKKDILKSINKILIEKYQITDEQISGVDSKLTMMAIEKPYQLTWLSEDLNEIDRINKIIERANELEQKVRESKKLISIIQIAKKTTGVKGFLKRVFRRETIVEKEAKQILTENYGINLKNLSEELKKQKAELRLLEGNYLDYRARDELRKKINIIEDSLFNYVVNKDVISLIETKRKETRRCNEKSIIDRINREEEERAREKRPELLIGGKSAENLKTETEERKQANILRLAQIQKKLANEIYGTREDIFFTRQNLKNKPDGKETLLVQINDRIQHYTKQKEKFNSELLRLKREEKIFSQEEEILLSQIIQTCEKFIQELEKERDRLEKRENILYPEEQLLKLVNRALDRFLKGSQTLDDIYNVETLEADIITLFKQHPVSDIDIKLILKTCLERIDDFDRNRKGQEGASRVILARNLFNRLKKLKN